MRKIYQNAFAKAILEASFNLTEFDRKEEQGRYIISYNHSSKLFYFSITINNERALSAIALALEKINGLYQVEMSPGQIASIENRSFLNWDSLLDGFTEWLEWIKEEIDVPDLWAEAAKAAQLFATTAEPSDDKFIRAELAEVQSQLRMLQHSFTASALPEVAKQKLIELTQTAAVKAEGLTKKDWQNWVIGGFIGAITNLALNPTQAGEVLKLIKAAFGGLFLH